jgi:hypothetical protein
MNLADYLSGLLLLGLTIAAFCAGALAMRRFLLPSWRGAPGHLATIVLSLAIAVTTCEVLGLIGLLKQGILVFAALASAICLRSWLPAGKPDPESTSVSESRLALAIACGAAALTALHWLGPVLNSLDVGIYRQDSTWYHLPQAAFIAQTGAVTGLLQTDTLALAPWLYPLNTELLHALGMVILGNDLASPFLNTGWMGLALFAAWCIGRPHGRAAATLLAAILVVGSDMMLVQAGNAPSDVAALACLLASIAILVNAEIAMPGSGPGSPARQHGALLVAGLAAGLAVGAKVTMVVPIGVLTVGLLFSGGTGRARRASSWLVGLAATGGFWYLRNLAHAGNPLPWLDPGPLSGPQQDESFPRPAHAMVEYLAERHAWTEFFFPGLAETLGPLWPLVVFAALAGIALGLRRHHPPLIRITALAGAAALVSHVFNPISASGFDGAPYGFASNLRYAAPGLAIGLVLLPLCETRWMANRVLLPFFALLALSAAIGSSEWTQALPATIACLVAFAALAMLWLLSSNGRRRHAAAFATGLLILVASVGYPIQRHYFENRYRATVAPPLDNPGFRAGDEWKLIQEWAREEHGVRIGIVGTPAAYGQYALYGSDLSNEVRYIGEPRPHGGLGPIHSCRAWRHALAVGHFDIVIVTPEDSRAPFLAPEIEWTVAGGSAVPVLRPLPAAILRITREPRESDCHRTATPWGVPSRGPKSNLPPGLWPSGRLRPS